jgi:hypothetical protein
MGANVESLYLRIKILDDGVGPRGEQVPDFMPASLRVVVNFNEPQKFRDHLLPYLVSWPKHTWAKRNDLTKYSVQSYKLPDR